MLPPNLTMFRCERKAMTLTQGACTKLWASAQGKDRPAVWEGRYACLGCPVGAGHNGTTVQRINVASEALRDICPRCGHGGRRLIHRDLCVSCYNRDREAQVQRNAKGNRPIICDALITRQIIVSRSGRSRAEHQRATSCEEMMMRIVKRAIEPVAFARALPSWIGPQSMFLFGSTARPARRPSARGRSIRLACDLQQALPF